MRARTASLKDPSAGCSITCYTITLLQEEDEERKRKGREEGGERGRERKREGQEEREGGE